MDKKMTIDVAAVCDRAGRHVNQDSIYMSCSDVLRMVETNDHYEMHGEDISLPPEGTLLVVADGMGGMNAGEVASQLVVATMAREMESIGGQSLADPERVVAMARRAIVDADSAIKQYVKDNPEASGTGSTVALLWLLGDKAVVAWCGDSRCYRYNPRRGLEQLSHDHSYVQQMVDEGKLRPELAFGHEHSNVITRCLCDDVAPAEPDVKIVDVYRDDIFMLCSDGLCGLLPDDVTEQLLKDAGNNVGQALSNCWQRGSAAGWDDNVSILLASINGAETIAPERKIVPLPPRPSYTPAATEATEADHIAEDQVGTSASRRTWWLVVAVLLLVVAIGVAMGRSHSKPATPVEQDTRMPMEAGPMPQVPASKDLSAPPYDAQSSDEEDAFPQEDPGKAEPGLAEEAIGKYQGLIQAQGE